jgi:hypothetical protein
VSDRKLKSEILRDVQILYGSRLSGGGGGGGGIDALTGDVTASGTGSVTATIAADAVTNAKLADMAANTLKGNNTGSAANPVDLTVSQVKSLLAISTSDVSGLGTLATQSGTYSGTSSGTNTGDVSLAGTPDYLTISGQTITRGLIDLATDVTGDLPFANIAQVATDRVVGRDTGGTGDIETLTVGGGIEFTGAGGIQTSALTGDVTKTAGGTTTTIANDAVTYAKMQDSGAGNVVLARSASGAGDYGEVALGSSELLGRGATGNVAAITLGTNLSMSGTTLNATGGGGISDGDKGDITVSGSGATWTVDNDVVTYAKMQNASAGNVVLARAASTSGDYSEVAVGASQLVGRGSTGDVAAITVGSGLSMSGTTLSAAGGGSSPVVFVAAGADTAINSVTDVTVVTRDVTSVGATDKLVVDCDFTIVNASGAARVYVVTLDFDGLFDVEFTTGSLAVTTGHFFNMRGTLDIRSTSLAYGTFTIEGGLIAGLASGADTTMVATHLRTRGWGTTASDASGTTTVALKIRSAASTATQTCRLHNLTISKYTPT